MFYNKNNKKHTRIVQQIQGHKANMKYINNG